MCKQHLLGEHVEMHMFAGAIRKGISMDGYISNGLVNTSLIHSRHGELVVEMETRGMKHNSSLPDFTIPDGPSGFVFKQNSLQELLKRCPSCAIRIKESYDSKSF
jgi:hypothetical protein